MAQIELCVNHFQGVRLPDPCLDLYCTLIYRDEKFVCSSLAPNQPPLYQKHHDRSPSIFPELWPVVAIAHDEFNPIRII